METYAFTQYRDGYCVDQGESISLEDAIAFADRVRQGEVDAFVEVNHRRKAVVVSSHSWWEEFVPGVLVIDGDGRVAEFIEFR